MEKLSPEVLQDVTARFRRFDVKLKDLTLDLKDIIELLSDKQSITVYWQELRQYEYFLDQCTLMEKYYEDFYPGWLVDEDDLKDILSSPGVYTG